MAIDERKRAKLTGKGKEHSFVMIPRYVLHSKQFLQLDPFAKALFMYWTGCFNGFNNGDFSAVRTAAGDIGFRSATTLDKAKRVLVETGFAVVTRQGEKRRCSLYGLTIWPIDDCNGKHTWPSERKPSNTWNKKSDAQQMGIRGPRRGLKLVKKAA